MKNCPFDFVYTLRVSSSCMYIHIIITQKLLGTSLWVLKSDVKLKNQMHYDQNRIMLDDFLIFPRKIRENYAQFEKDKLMRMLINHYALPWGSSEDLLTRS